MSRIHRLLRLARTVRYLRPVQIWGRVWFRAYRPRVDARPAPALHAAGARWQACARADSMVGPQTFRFLDTEHTLTDARDWNRTEWSRLWLYNLHYFDDLGADTAPERSAWHRALITRWITENPPASGPGWEPYPTSLRIVNWVKWALAGNALDDAARDSLATQARWLRKREEIHLQGNHLWANAKALVSAGAFFSGDEAERWRLRGLTRVRHELTEQILPDGGHYERSPMYHAIVLEDLLDLIQLADIYPACFDASETAQWRNVATRMLRWLRVMTHADGGIALFNDAAMGIAPDYIALRAYASTLDMADDVAELAVIEALSDSGYVRLQAGPAVLIADVGEIGPAHLPGHAHADTLSFEFSLRSERVLVNGGTSTYDASPERLRQRGTRAQNTVIVNAVDSSEVWSSFRVARRAHPLEIAYGSDSGHVWLRAAHDGYTWLSGQPVPQREWRLSNTRLTVTDTIRGSFAHAEVRLHVHPNWNVVVEDAGSGRLEKRPAGRPLPPLHWRADPGANISESTYHPRFGAAQPCDVIEIRFNTTRVQFTLAWGEDND